MSDPWLRTRGNWKWRLAHSSWLLWPILTFGIATGPAFLYVGLRARRRSWWIWGLVYGVTSLTGWVLAGAFDEDRAITNVGVALMFGGWIPAIVHASIINPLWLTFLAQHQLDWRYASYQGQQQSYIDPTSARAVSALGVDPSLHYSAPGPSVDEQRLQPAYPNDGRIPAQAAPLAPAPSSVDAPVPGDLDVNVATTEQLAALPGVSDDIAQRAVDRRAQVGTFRDLDDFALASDIPPHVFAKVRDRLVCREPARQRPTGRILDI